MPVANRGIADNPEGGKMWIDRRVDLRDIWPRCLTPSGGNHEKQQAQVGNGDRVFQRKILVWESIIETIAPTAAVRELAVRPARQRPPPPEPSPRRHPCSP